MRLEQGVDRRKRGKDMAAKPFGVGVLAVLLGGNVEIDAVLTWHRESHTTAISTVTQPAPAGVQSSLQRTCDHVRHAICDTKAPHKDHNAAG